MELTRLKIKRFKKIREVELSLSDLNILVGANGSGKSSIIQAVHFASTLIRQASDIRSDSPRTVAINELDYLPTNSYSKLGHKQSWGNPDGSPSSQVTFTFQSEDNTEKNAYCVMRAARNAGISIRGVGHPLLRDKNKFFSAYIPGISGIPNQEEKKSKRVVLKACSHGDSNVYLRNVLTLLKQDSGSLETIEEWLEEIIGTVKISVNHDEEKDLEIKSDIRIQGRTHPIEMVGAGILQLIQIFCYIRLFQPKILLIDEPDIHLHPNIQEIFPQVLSKIAKDTGMKVLMTTHSPFIIRGAPIDTNIFWVKDGIIEDESREQIELILGWGAFGKKVLMISEDSNTSLLKKLIKQWPDIDKFVAFIPGNGFRNLPTPQQAKEISIALGDKFKILVHRDRDSMIDAEVTSLIQLYDSQDVHLWCTEFSDIEEYFCQSNYLQNFLGCTEVETEAYIQDIFQKNATPINDQFENHRKNHNSELYKEGGSPTNEVVWKMLQSRPLKGAKGKFIFNQLKNVIPGNKFSEKTIINHALGVEIADDIKKKLETLLTE